MRMDFFSYAWRWSGESVYVSRMLYHFQTPSLSQQLDAVGRLSISFGTGLLGSATQACLTKCHSPASAGSRCV